MECAGSRVTGLAFGWGSRDRGLVHYGDRSWVGGDVGLLAWATALEEIGLRLTSVSGSIEPLAALTQLRRLYLEQTDVYGDATVLRAIPGLGSDWPGASWSTDGSYYASLCSAFAGGCPAGSSPIADNSTFVGNDACACCTATADLSRDAAGACIDATQG